MIFNACAVSHSGNVRDNNEDNLYFSHKGIRDNSESKAYFYASGIIIKPRFFAVFDGMGGMNHGEEASFMAANTAKAMFENAKAPIVPEDFLKEICYKSNADICKAMVDGDGLRMGTTAAMMYFEKENFHICNIGDSPVLRVSNGKISQISVDHNEREAYIKLHGPDFDPKKKFRLTQHLGIFPEEMSIEPYYYCEKLRQDETFVISSDGLTDSLEKEEIEAICCTYDNSCDIARKLLKRALEIGGKDNISIICVRMKRFSSILLDW